MTNENNTEKTLVWVKNKKPTITEVRTAIEAVYEEGWERDVLLELADAGSYNISFERLVSLESAFELFKQDSEKWELISN